MKLSFITIIFSLVITVHQSLACSCENLNAESLLKNSDSVSLAIAKDDSMRIVREMSGEEDLVGRSGMLTEFEIINDYKNSNLKELRVLSPIRNQGRCGVGFKKDEVIVLSTITHPTTFEQITTSCSIAYLDNKSTYELVIKLDSLSR